MDNDVEDGDKAHADVGKIYGKGLLRRRHRRLASIPSCCRLTSEFPRREPLREIFVEIQMNLEQFDSCNSLQKITHWRGFD